MRRHLFPFDGTGAVRAAAQGAKWGRSGLQLVVALWRWARDTKCLPLAASISKQKKDLTLKKCLYILNQHTYTLIIS